MRTKRSNLANEESNIKAHPTPGEQDHITAVNMSAEHGMVASNDDNHQKQRRSPLVKRTVLTLLVLLLAACSNTGKISGSGNAVNQVQNQVQNQTQIQATQAALPTVTETLRSTGCTVDETSLQQSLLALVNEARAQARQCGTTRYSAAAALTNHPTLQQAAKVHSRDMADNNFFNHQDADGLQVWDRATAAGYSYARIAENIAAGQNTTGQVHDGWLGSPGHCANIMDPDVTHFGAACVRSANSDNQSYWTTVFGRERKSL